MRKISSNVADYLSENTFDKLEPLIVTNNDQNQRLIT